MTMIAKFEDDHIHKSKFIYVKSHIDIYYIVIFAGYSVVLLGVITL